MRIAGSVLVVSKKNGKISLGLLSRNHLRNSEEEEPDTPTVTFSLPKNQKLNNKEVNEILKWTPFSNFELFVSHISSLNSFNSGTILFLFDLDESTDDSSLEIDFTTDPHDFLIKKKEVSFLFFKYTLFFYFLFYYYFIFYFLFLFLFSFIFLFSFLFFLFLLFLLFFLFLI